MTHTLRVVALLFAPVLLTACIFPAPQKPSESAILPAVDNCAVGCPTGGSDNLLIRQVYTLNNNGTTKFANWVAYKITKTSQASGRSRYWQQDPDLPADETLAPAAYRDAHGALAVDRGHQAPLAGLGGNPDWPALNYLSNITPQKSALNQGPWARLENQERALANRPDVQAVYVVTGPLFEQDLGVLPAAPSVKIPSGYWKVVFIKPGLQSGQFAAFIMEQTVARSANFCDYQVTVSEIEKRTQPALRLWPALNPDSALWLKNSKGRLATEEMGCP